RKPDELSSASSPRRSRTGPPGGARLRPLSSDSVLLGAPHKARRRSFVAPKNVQRDRREPVAADRLDHHGIERGISVDGLLDLSPEQTPRREVNEHLVQ